eukprot:1157267-Pelagomonas_calceolata.AAC.4
MYWLLATMVWSHMLLILLRPFRLKQIAGQIGRFTRAGLMGIVWYGKELVLPTMLENLWIHVYDPVMLKPLSNLTGMEDIAPIELHAAHANHTVGNLPHLGDIWDMRHTIDATQFSMAYLGIHRLTIKSLGTLHNA